MLRGLDQGYDIPSYGVMISQKHSNKGFGKLTLYHAIAYCKLNGIKILMLKVHPDNLYAKKMYLDLGFEHTGTDERIGHLVLQKRLSK
jgi:L-amino acid N-acyltransferase YncA